MELEELGSICQNALYLAHVTSHKLGEEGKKEDKGEDIIVTKGDNAVSRALTDFLKENLPFAKIQSEEGKIIKCPENPDYLITFDEIDGTFNYHRGILPYCTVLTVFPYKKELKFDDVLYGGVLEHTTEKLWYAIKGKGCFLLERDNLKAVRSSGRKNIEDDGFASVVIDEGPNVEKERQRKYEKIIERTWVRNISCAGLHLAGVASGGFDGFLCSIQKAHELGAGYRLIKEAGGVVLDFNGEFIDDKVYNFDSKYRIIAASSLKLARELAEIIV